METAVFLKWRDAFIDYFFRRDNDDEVFLYVNKDIIDQIGKEYKLGDLNSYLNVVLLNREERRELYSYLYYMEYGVTPPQKRVCQYANWIDASLYKFAYYLGDSLQKYNYCLPYIILAVYIASLTEGGNEKSIREKFRKIIQNKIECDSGRYDVTVVEDENGGKYGALEVMFEWLHEEYPMFNNRLRGNHRYIGLLKYQLLLSQSEINEINKALYTIQFNGEENNRSYLDKVRLLKDYVNEKVKTILVDSLDNVDYQYRINRIIDNFDLETYQEKNPNANRIKLHFGFVHLLWFDEISNKRGFKLLTNLRDCSVETNDYKIQKSANTIGGYNAEFVNYKDSDSVLLEEKTKLNSEDFDITPMPLDDVVFFYKYNDEYFIQSRESLNQEAYIFVKRKCVEGWEKWAANGHVSDLLKIEDKEVEDLTQNKWTMYLAQGVLAPYYDTYKDGRKTLKNNVRAIARKGGMLPPGKNNTYLINALPYFEFPEDIDTDKLSVYMNMDNDTQDEGNDFSCIVCGNRLIIDICKDVDLTDSCRIDLKIEYGNELNAYEYFYVCGQNVNYNEPNLFMINKWGEKIDEPTEKYIQGNSVLGIIRNVMGNEQTVLSEEDLEDDINLDFDEFYFINLLAACIYMEPNSTITRNRLEKCIRYAATRLDIDTNQIAFTTKVINLLVNAGYISADYISRHYQAIPPAFHKINLFVGGDVDFTGKGYMITGLYTRKFLTDLCNYCRNKGVNVKYRYSDLLKNSRSYLRLLPPILILEKKFNPEQFIEQYPMHHVFFDNDNDMAMDILTMTPSISEYSKSLVTIPQDSFNVDLVNTSETRFPRVREDNPYAYNNHVYVEETDNSFLRPTISEHAWAGIYCYYKRNNPFIIQNSETIYIPTDLHLPSLIQRALFISNIGIASYKKAFICDNPSDGNVFYTIVKTYKITKNRQDKLCAILTGKGVKDNPLVKHAMKTIDIQHDWKYEMELWTRKEILNSSIPKKILVLKEFSKKTHVRILAYANFKNVFYRSDKDVYIKVDGLVNQVMSMLIKDKHWSPKLDKKSISVDLPSADKYDKESLIII